jgi:hypothetical protein
VEESAETQHGFPGGGIPREMQRFRHGDVEPAGDYLLLGLPVIGWFDDYYVQPRLAKITLAQRDDQRQMICV